MKIRVWASAKTGATNRFENTFEGIFTKEELEKIPESDQKKCLDEIAKDFAKFLQKTGVLGNDIDCGAEVIDDD